jgi:hypothetical protein
MSTGAYLIDSLGDRLGLGDLSKKLNVVLVAKELLHPLVLASEGLPATRSHQHTPFSTMTEIEICYNSCGLQEFSALLTSKVVTMEFSASCSSPEPRP